MIDIDNESGGSGATALPLSSIPQRPAISWRSVLLGLVGIVFICGLTPYNNYPVNNTDLVGNFLPCGMLLFFLAFVMVVNAPLHKWRPRWALGANELAVAMGMVLVSCTLPAVGMMRYLPGHLAAFFSHASGSGEYRELLARLHLPDWLWPTFPTADLAARGNDPIVREFYEHVQRTNVTLFGHAVDPNSFLGRVAAVPWRAWARPALTWGIFLGALYGATMCLTVIFRRQWVENERLPFPLASIYLSLIETPKQGHAFNSLFRVKRFWIAFAAVFVVHGFNGLHAYAPKCPTVPMYYDFGNIFADAPWSYMEGDAKYQTIYFTIIGLCFFVQTKVLFSLWFAFVAVQAARIISGQNQSQITKGMEQDQVFGALLPFAISILWVARGHLATVVRQMFRRPKGNEARGRYLPYALAGWGFVLCLLTLVVWMTLAGASPVGAVVIVLMVMMFYLVLAKVVAETGLIYVLIPVELSRPFVYAAAEVPKWMSARASLGSFFFSSMFSGVLVHDLRQALPAYSTHALRVADSAAYEGETRWRKAAPFTLLLMLSLAAGYLVSGVSTLYVRYNYHTTLDQTQVVLDNGWGSHTMPREMTLDPTLKFIPPGTGSQEAHSRLGHFAFGAALTTTLSVLRLRYGSFPLHPVGFLMVYTWGLRQTWFSIFLGWLAKTIVVRFGGGSMYRTAKDFFIGLIIGETAAAAFWLCVSLVRVTMGLDYHSVQLLPS